MDKKYQIFVSSTYTDLIEERQAVSKAVLDLGHIPAGMELFAATDSEQLTYIKKVIDECDYYVLIVAGRYGSLDDDGVSYTEREFEYALSTGKTVLAFVHNDTSAIAYGKSEADPVKRSKLENFINRVMSGRLIKRWSSALELRSEATVALVKAFSEVPQTGWVRADRVPTHSTLEDVLRYREQIEALTAEVSRFRGELIPQFDDVADLSKKITISITGYRRINGAGIQLNIDMSLKQFLQATGPDFMKGATENSIYCAIENWIGTQNTDIRISEMSTPDLRAPVMTLMALGIIDVFTERLSNGAVLLKHKITEKGRKAWQETGYIRV